MNKFLVFEGIDSSGKSTQIKLLEEKLKDNNIEFIIFREPGGNNVSEKIREILLDKTFDICDETETLLFLSSRAQNTKFGIIPQLEKNKFVICDRYTDSTLAYQGYGKKINKDLINSFNIFATQKIEPKLTIILDIDLKISKIRNLNDKDRMEQNSDIFFHNVIVGYRRLASSNPSKYFLINADQSVEKIHKLIWDKILMEFDLC